MKFIDRVRSPFSRMVSQTKTKAANSVAPTKHEMQAVLNMLVELSIHTKWHR